MHEVITGIFKDENPKSIFDVGCGSGILMKTYYDAICRYRQGDDYYFPENLKVGGIDILFENVERAKENFPEYADNFLCLDATKPWPLADKSYDIVFTVGTLLCIPDPYPILKEMLRVGKKVILAEFQQDDATDTGEAIPYEIIYKYRIYRDYRKVFEKLNVPIEILETVSGKTIIKTCQKSV